MAVHVSARHRQDLRPDATIQEHCILFGSYYPTDTTQEAITCLHDKDVNGNDVTSLHIVH